MKGIVSMRNLGCGLLLWFGVYDDAGGRGI